MAFFVRYWQDLSYLALSLLLGVSGAIFSDLSLSGLLWRGELFVLTLVPVLMGAVFVAEIVWSSRKFQWWLIRAFLWPVGSFVIVFIGWQVAERQLPDAAQIYLRIRQPYIEANWKVDPQTGLIYFPIRYERLDKESKEVPQFFFALDKDNAFVIAPYSDNLVRPFCRKANYAARKVSGQVYLVQLYVNDPDEPSEPCLITPSEASSHD